MPTDPVADKPGQDVPGMIMAVVFIIVAAVALWDTTTMADSDSYVFPRAVATAMIVFSLGLIVWNLVVGTSKEVGQAAVASTPRRLGLVVVMLLGTGLMPYIGFVLSTLIVFAAIMLIAMYDPWTRFRKIVYPLVCVGVVLGFYVIFAKVLLVPLPTGLLLD